MRIALIDADIVAFRAAAVSNNDPHEGAALERVDYTMQMILDNIQTNQYKAFLTGSSNFRKWLDPTYKANRKDKPLPTYLNQTREHLITKWKASVSIDCEADDMMGIAQCSLEPDTSVICSIDKDLLQIPGRHWNFVNGTPWDITETRGFYNFMIQMAMGDVSDNVNGLPGIGKKKAPRLVDVLGSEEDWIRIVSEEYKKHPELDFDLNWKLLWIARTEDYLEEILDEARLRYASMSESGNTPSSEPGLTDQSGTPVDGVSTDESLKE